MSEDGNSAEGAAEAARKLVEPAPRTFGEFLESVPPAQLVKVTHLWGSQRQSGSSSYKQLLVPDIQLHCTSNDCNALRFYRFEGGETNLYRGENLLDTFITYRCSNCRSSGKIFSLHAEFKDDGAGECCKFGEIPPYGPPTPSRLIRLFGSDRETFLKGGRCEIQGLGIGAFVYCRRVVENHKSQILGEIIRVAQKLEVPADKLQTLEDAKNEKQFSKAVESAKDAIPQSLLINGQNPLTLLYSALSIGIHEQTDEKCLELAHDVRVVLVELSERLGQALKDEAELDSAVSRLMKARQDKSE
jgi:hypothetical protein